MDIYRDPIWEEMMSWLMPIQSQRTKTNWIADNGLKSIIRRPHSLVNVKNDAGKVIAQRLEMVTTPFSKKDVTVSITNNILSVECGSENIKDCENEDVVYRGISQQAYSFQLQLAPSVDQSKITAENKDGVLKITLPLIAEDKKLPETTVIDIA